MPKGARGLALVPAAFLEDVDDELLFELADGFVVEDPRVVRFGDELIETFGQRTLENQFRSFVARRDFRLGKNAAQSRQVALTSRLRVGSH
jgi:hypothetical protein